MRGAASALAIALAIAAGAGCSPRRDPNRVVLWHHYHGEEKRALERVAAEINAEGEVELELVQVPYSAFVDKVTSAVPRGNGPDLFIYAHDRLGDWAGDVAEPIEFYVDEELADRFAYDSLSALAWKGSLYGLPVAVKLVALFYRTDLWDQPPRSTRELLSAGPRLHEQGAYPLVYENTELYYHAVWLHAFGGRVFDDRGELTLDTPAGIRAAKLARELREREIVPHDTRSRSVASQFNEGAAAAAISGPWFVGDIADGVPWSIAPLPIVSETGERARPYLGIDGVFMSARAHNKDAAFEVMRRLTSDDSALIRARRARQIVPNLSVYDRPGVADDEVLAAFRAELDDSVLMPATQAMRQVWVPYKTALQKAVRGGADPSSALARAQSEVESYLEGAKPR